MPDTTDQPAWIRVTDDPASLPTPGEWVRVWGRRGEEHAHLLPQGISFAWVIGDEDEAERLEPDAFTHWQPIVGPSENS